MYGPLSYYRLGAVYPRSRFRESYPEPGRAGYRRRAAELAATGAGRAVRLYAGRLFLGRLFHARLFRGVVVLPDPVPGRVTLDAADPLREELAVAAPENETLDAADPFRVELVAVELENETLDAVDPGRVTLDAADPGRVTLTV